MFFRSCHSIQLLWHFVQSKIFNGSLYRTKSQNAYLSCCGLNKITAEVKLNSALIRHILMSAENGYKIMFEITVLKKNISLTGI